MSPLIMLTVVVILVCVPLSIGAAVFLWQLYREDKGTFSLLLASVITATTTASILIAIPAVLFVVNADPELRRVTGAFTLIALDILLIAPIVIAGYLRLLRQRK